MQFAIDTVSLLTLMSTHFMATVLKDAVLLKVFTSFLKKKIKKKVLVLT